MKFRQLLHTASSIAIMSGGGVAFAQADGDRTDRALGRDEIVVTSTRREESVLDVPYNISAIRGEGLKELGVTALSDLRNAVPGLTSPDYGGRGDNVNNGFIIRGVNTLSAGGTPSLAPNLQTATTSVYIDEIPLFANLTLTDIDRVEVLRGPQGTLFGSGSVGGTIRIISNRPDFDGFSYTANAEFSNTTDSANINYGGDIVLNLPIAETLALRVGAGYTQEAGVIDALGAVALDGSGVPFLGSPLLADPSDVLNSGFVFQNRIEDYDDRESWFVRSALRWQPVDAVDIEATYQRQVDESGGFTFQTPGLERENLRRFPEEFSETTVDAAGLTASVDFGFATLTSATSYAEVQTESAVDFTGIFASFDARFAAYGFFPRLIGLGDDRFGSQTFAQEVRLVSNGDGPWDYVVGAYYRDFDTNYVDEEYLPGFTEWAQLPTSGAAAVAFLGLDGYYGLSPTSTFSDVMYNYYPGIRPEDYPTEDLVFDFFRDTDFSEWAIFGELTYNVTERLDVTFGARYFEQDFTQDLVSNGYSLGTATGGVVNQKFEDVIFKGNVAYDLTDDLLTYFTFSQGFRTGGANPVTICESPTQRRCEDPEVATFDPDTSNNFEFGMKGSVLDGGLTFSAALYQLNWNDIQFEAGSFDGTTVVVNGNKARSRGAEIEAVLRLSDSATINGGYAYNKSELTEPAIAGAGGSFGAIVDIPAGSRLPTVSPHQFNLGFNYVGNFTDSLEGFFNVNMNYRSSFPTRTDASDASFRELDGFAVVNTTIGLDVREGVRLSLFATNIFDTLGVNGVALGGPATPAAVSDFNSVEFIQRPRTIGLRLRLDG